MEGLSADLPKTVYPLSDFLAAQIYSYPNKKTGKMMHHSIGLGKWNMAMVGRNIQIDPVTGKPAVNPPDFVFKLVLAEAKDTAVKLPHLLQAIEQGNSFSWPTDRVVKEAKDLYEVWRINSQLDHIRQESLAFPMHQNGLFPHSPSVHSQANSPIFFAGSPGPSNSGFNMATDPILTPWER